MVRYIIKVENFQNNQNLGRYNLCAININGNIKINCIILNYLMRQNLKYLAVNLSEINISQMIIMEHIKGF